MIKFTSSKGNKSRLKASRNTQKHLRDNKIESSILVQFQGLMRAQQQTLWTFH